jgi:hypothetical protein
MNIRVWYKTHLSKYRLIPEFCKCCGRDTRGFLAPNDVWDKVATYTGVNVLCYDCFCDICGQLGFLAVWKLNDPLTFYRELPMEHYYGLLMFIRLLIIEKHQHDEG